MVATLEVQPAPPDAAAVRCHQDVARPVTASLLALLTGKSLGSCGTPISQGACPVCSPIPISFGSQPLGKGSGLGNQGPGNHKIIRTTEPRVPESGSFPLFLDRGVRRCVFSLAFVLHKSTPKTYRIGLTEV